MGNVYSNHFVFLSCIIYSMCNNFGAIRKQFTVDHSLFGQSSRPIKAYKLETIRGRHLIKVTVNGILLIILNTYKQ